ncbi:MAG TPA: YegS/Rv2252/BmrU family lipid kinase [Acidimicrobiia bacterium]|nr:YegS/Rv2252/BmrU family lipid kinase [Acidimicrobiia bacterium]
MTDSQGSARWLMVVNSNAGRGANHLATLSAAARSRMLEVDIVATHGESDLHAIVHDAHASGVRGFVAVGGDGTAHHLLNALPVIDVEDRVSLSVIPTGSGSDFVRTFGQDNDIDAAMDRLVGAERYAIDVGEVTGSFGTRRFINAANAGIAAQSVVTAGRLPRRLGTAKYTMAFWLTLARFPGAEVDVRVDHHRFTGEALNVVIANGQFFGGGLNVAPRATLVDGRFDVLVFAGRRSNAFSVMPRLAFGAHLTHRAVHRYIGSRVSIDGPDSWPIEADGELLGHGSVTAHVMPAAIDYIV